MVVKVGAVDIQFFSLPFDGESFGDFNYLTMRIRVDENLKGPPLVDTVKHELNHAIWSIYHLKTKKEEEERKKQEELERKKKEEEEKIKAEEEAKA